ncbi:hypothetical protein L284_03560 [Novosphingobium lindaniclasticum LE124]|uniref:Uncharacterized protein n=1 Tax=Novosphingobium lindaniclasticum LE124 TaxID=1096930 RepID=T0JAM1_9SPHN|nr:hypothetical protein L284_03560 [Novosphingobium lindaniclasticum LE124]
MAGFFRHAGVKDDLQQEIAKFVSQADQILTSYGICNFVGFLDGIRRDRREVLSQIPFATGHRITKAGHYTKETVELLMAMVCHEG